jgi:hypothetical protein
MVVKCPQCNLFFTHTDVDKKCPFCKVEYKKPEETPVEEVPVEQTPAEEPVKEKKPFAKPQKNSKDSFKIW